MEEQFESYKMVMEEASGQLIEKKSRFLATLSPVYTQEEAAAFIERVKKRYYDASHSCSAFVVGERFRHQRCSDDGEPQGTAGKPMLEVLQGEGLTNTVAVVTRYFGGTLLGTGGLVRAYTQAVQAGIAAARIVTMRYGVKLSIGTDYNSIGRIQHILARLGYVPEDAVYTDQVTLTLIIPYEEEELVKKELTEASFGKAVLEELDRYYYIDKS